MSYKFLSQEVYIKQWANSFVLCEGKGVVVVRRSESMTSLLSTCFFHTRTVHLDIIKVFYSLSDAQVNCLKNNIKIYIKTAPTCFGAVVPSSGSALFVLAKVTVVKIVN
jgi:hypothetical protein